MRRTILGAIVAILLSGAALAEYPFAFRDVAKESSAGKILLGSRAHACAWGDVDGDGWPDLFVGTFHTSGKPAQLLLNKKGKFVLDEQDAVRVSACASGALFVDLDNTGRLDLYVSCNAMGKTGVRSQPSRLFRNEGKGKLVDVSKDCGACPPGVQGRTVAAADIDGDGKLDLIVSDFYYAPKAKYGVRVFRNKGGHHFEEITAKCGIPEGTAFPGVAACDLNGDGWPDLFLTAADGSNRLLLNDGKGKFKEAPGSREAFAWKGLSKNDPLAGVAIADVNGDGLPDVVIGHHFKQPWRGPTAIRLYLHRGTKGGVPRFEDVTEKVGLTPLAMKAPHVEIQDMDNDGLPDIVTSIVKFSGGKPYPVIFRNLGVKDGLPKFRDDAWAVNDFPNKDDLAPKRTADFYARLLKERKITYTACAPVCDFDRDGRLDIAVPVWWEEEPPLLLRNETKGGNWLDVRVEGKGKVNRQGVGAVVRLRSGGKLIAAREITLGHGWCSGGEACVQFGLGKLDKVDVEVTLPHGHGTIRRTGVKANQRLVVRMEAP
jgi:hypothetical protein